MITKVLKRMSSILICILLTIGTTISVYADLSAWNCDSNTIGTWGDTQIKYGHKKLNNNSYFYFYASGLHAVKQWEDALGISIENVVMMSDANIKAYGGTWDEITALGFAYYPSALGYAYPLESSLLRVDTIDGKEISVRQLEGYAVVILDKGLTSDYNYVTTHELGHALGWYGHSTESRDLMYKTSNNTTELTTRDKEHLSQLY